jgi:hypothetical protein
MKTPSTPGGADTWDIYCFKSVEMGTILSSSRPTELAVIACTK